MRGRNKVFNSQRFDGGQSVDESLGLKYSHAYSKALDFRKKPSQLTVLPAPRRIGKGVTADLIQDVVQIPNGARYALGTNGTIYKISNSNVMTSEYSMDAGAWGAAYRADTDSVYFTSATAVSRIFGASNATPVFQPNKYSTSHSIDSKSYRNGGVLTFTPQTSEATTILETALQKCEFQPDIEPLYSIKILIKTVGTGDWSVIVHDDANNELGRKQIVNASLIANTLNEFTFSAPITMLVKPNARTYHFHVISTVNDGTLACGTANDLSTADFQVVAPRLISTNNGIHPIANFLHLTVVGNGRYLSAWEPLSDDPSNAEWQRHRLTFPPGYEVCGLAVTDEFLVIGAEKRSTSSTRNFQDGKLFFWDGLSDTYNFFIDVPEGSPEALSTYHNVVYFIANGVLCAWAGGRSFSKLRTIADTNGEYTDLHENTRVYPNAMAVRRGVLKIGYPGITTSTTLQHGIYSWGALDKNFDDSFGYESIISTNNNLFDGTNTKQIGCVRSFGDEMYISWRDDDPALDSHYGLDIIDNFSDPAPSATWESRVFDAGFLFKPKAAKRLKIWFDSLPSGITLTPKFKIDGGSWEYGDAVTTGTYTITDLSNRQFHDIQYGFSLTLVATQTPVIKSIALEYDPQEEEDVFSE